LLAANSKELVISGPFCVLFTNGTFLYPQKNGRMNEDIWYARKDYPEKERLKNNEKFK